MTNPKHTDTSRSGDLVARLRKARVWPDYSQSRVTIETAHEAADRIEQLEREKAVVSDLWEQQKEIALGYLADCNKAADRIAALEAEVARLERLLEGRDNFIVNQGLFPAFLDTLPKTQENSHD